MNCLRTRLVFGVALIGSLTACGQSADQQGTADQAQVAAAELSKMGPSLEKSCKQPELMDDYQCGRGASSDSASSHDRHGRHKSHEKKVQVCHVPPGNPDARHTVCISAEAASAHLRRHHDHGGSASDYLGPCVTSTPAPPPVTDDGSGAISDDDSGGSTTPPVSDDTPVSDNSDPTSPNLDDPGSDTSTGSSGTDTTTTDNTGEPPVVDPSTL